jgi:hypothetical protein
MTPLHLNASPCISTGVYGYPSDRAASVALKAVNDWLQRNPNTVCSKWMNLNQHQNSPDIHMRISSVCVVYNMCRWIVWCFAPSWTRMLIFIADYSILQRMTDMEWKWKLEIEIISSPDLKGISFLFCFAVPYYHMYMYC